MEGTYVTAAEITCEVQTAKPTSSAERDRCAIK